MLLRRRIQLGGGLLALGVVALFTGHPTPVRGDRSGGHNLESHQYKDSRKCLLTTAAFGCNGDKRMVKRHADKRQHGGGGGGGGRGIGGGGGDGGGEERGGGVDGGGGDMDNDLDHNGSFDYNYDDGGGKGDGDDGGYGGEEGSPDTIDYYDPPLITDPRDRMLPVIYNPRPIYVPQEPLPPPPFVPSLHPHQQPPLPPYNRYNDEVPPIRPLILECPPTEDGFERFACPSPDKEGRFRCIDDHVLCDGYIDCPNGDDEDRKNCFFFKTTKAHLDILADALLRWARGR